MRIATTYIGTHYEYTIQTTLRHCALLLHRTGGRSDAGTDLLGTWHLPTHEHPLRVLVQCKALKTKLGPNLVRELEGTFAQAPVGWRSRTHSHTHTYSGSGGGGGSVVGVLVSPREATRGVRGALAKIPGMDQVERDMLRAQDRWFALWGVGEERYEEVVEVVERLFPEEKPLLFARDGRVTGLTEEEMQVVRTALATGTTHTSTDTSTIKV
ncbi:hypothetical protein BO70DRAFT_431308 [Aspergillus heteromorphus CBS 117.55]|uniref:Restriction endonuclease type IV Mrr domain-containing protein n=1 Tax=Aspergillus heteromorphus CBS 117.55 TaxID=1448321 RepID=A0A317VMY3_9EURO|nr:uncharacterized protein BO70DRAFT_431308 [Aspergillus heteromorphus CBS 117.55]PWY74447.1 hypothetical protein BO70DRAFT_431308 [Aspergillus heteromorphus CBS 117.55]